MMGNKRSVHPERTLSDKFEVLEQLDGKGHFPVFRARQVTVGRDVALKLTNEAVESSDPAWRRLVDAAQALARIEHPAVAGIYDVGRDHAGRGFVAMELCPGQDLDGLVRQSGSLWEGDVVELGRQMLSGIGAAHAVGVVHGAIHPRYVMVEGAEGDGTVRCKVFGFGLLDMEAEDRVRDVGFMAPEVIDGESPSVESDLYSVAVVLFWTLTGRMPWPDGNGDRRWLEETALDVVEDVGHRLSWAAFFRVAFVDDVEDRFASAEEMAGYLDKVWSGQWEESTSITGAERVFGRYRLIRMLARGGMGELHLARLSDGVRQGRVVVLKMARADFLADDRYRDRFSKEALMASRMNHPNLALVYEVGNVDGVLYSVQEWVLGRNGRQILQRAEEDRSSVPLALALFIGREACSGLDYLHRRGVGQGLIHGDVSPENIVVSYEGGVKVVDFGSLEQAEHANSGPLFVKETYQAPELKRGAPATIQSDLFALGAVLHELVFGRRVGESGSVSIPAAVGRVLALATCEDPKGRYESAAAFHDDLSELLARLAPRGCRRQLGAYVRDLFPAEYHADLKMAGGLESRLYQAISDRSFPPEELAELDGWLDEGDGDEVTLVGVRAVGRSDQTKPLDLADTASMPAWKDDTVTEAVTSASGGGQGTGARESMDAMGEIGPSDGRSRRMASVVVTLDEHVPPGRSPADLGQVGTAFWWYVLWAVALIVGGCVGWFLRGY